MDPYVVAQLGAVALGLLVLAGVFLLAWRHSSPGSGSMPIADEFKIIGTAVVSMGGAALFGWVIVTAFGPALDEIDVWGNTVRYASLASAAAVGLLAEVPWKWILLALVLGYAIVRLLKWHARETGYATALALMQLQETQVRMRTAAALLNDP